MSNTNIEYAEMAHLANKEGKILEKTEHGFRLKDPDPLPLDELKTEKLKEINRSRDRAEQRGFPYLGKVFDSDPVSVQRLSCAAQTALLCKTSGQPFMVTWTCKDNSIINLDADQMIGAIPALTLHSGGLHAKAAILKDAVRDALSADEVEAALWQD